jgi:hypothetical protein
MQRTIHFYQDTDKFLRTVGWTMNMLSKQMGNSVSMLEQHYSKLTATMAAERLA